MINEPAPRDDGEANFLVEVRSWGKRRRVALLRQLGVVHAGTWWTKDRLAVELLRQRRALAGEPAGECAPPPVTAQDRPGRAEAPRRPVRRAGAQSPRQGGARPVAEYGGDRPPYAPAMGVVRVGEYSYMAHPGAIGDGFD
jgi:hypothetical protein